MGSKPKPFMNIGPGFFIREELEARGWTQSDLAKVLGVSSKHLSQIMTDKQAITLDVAKLLGTVFGQSPQYWLNLYVNYKIRTEPATRAQKAAASKAEIFSHMPIRQMVERGWIKGWGNDVGVLADQVKKFWGINEVDFCSLEKQFAPAFRRSKGQKYNQYFALCWYRMAQKCARLYKVPVFNRRGLTKLANGLAEYSYYGDGIEAFLEDLNAVGVKFFVLPHLEKTYTDGAAFWDRDNPVIVWTGRYRREDNFWFTVAHEIAHVVLHLRTKGSFFIDCEQLESDKQEEEANAFAASSVRRGDILTAIGSGPITHHKVNKCAEQLHISPAVIVGQLHHMDRLPQSHLRRFLADVLDDVPDTCFPERRLRN